MNNTFNHKAKTLRKSNVLAGPAFEVSEAAYTHFLALCQVAYNAINRAYPKDEREKTPRSLYRHQDSISQVKQHLTFYKSIVKNDILPLAIIRREKAAYDFHLSDFALEDRTKDWEDRPTFEFRALIVLNAFAMLHTRLKDYAELLLPDTEVEGYIRVLDSTYHNEREALLKELSYYKVTPSQAPIDLEKEKL